MRNRERYLAIGIHQSASDTAGVDGVKVFDVAGVFVSGIAIGEEENTASRDVLTRAITARAALLEHSTFIAVRYGAVFADQAEAVAKFGASAPSWRSLLERYPGEVEFTLRAGSGTVSRPDRRNFTRGADYLRELHRMRQPATDPQFRETAGRLLGSHASGFRWVERHDGSEELAILVPREQQGEIAAAAEELRRKFPATPFLVSGPWPLEVFTDE
ncbi:MAG: GvpL/GvpF family gas vesicle protein [Thermoanaerobaculia bacterium]